MSQKRNDANWQPPQDRPEDTILHFPKNGYPGKYYDRTHGNLRGRANMQKAAELENAVYFQRCGKVLNILSNPKRVEVVLKLADGEQSVTKLADQVDLSQSALSQHLAKMREAGVVKARRHGLVVYYRLAMPELIGLLKEVTRFLEANSEKA
ncbi:ArsR/SmtB family transcription factor [Agrobacterium radiobacter]|uniref:ArsR/SmtB family transcription factor n=1 Tax=Agrobacterium tumefaciens complex TaxID=1183400 RepID=UPI001CBF5EA6|nr:metalloregulator ArsR/SmtB family transcription factor [Agrobacterium tumefaciens]UNZ54218.1 metalloregulator ArsR/SmtB family transcription factor [Agrobacterium tumefaciens]